MVKYIAETVLRKNSQSYNITAEKFFESKSIGKDLLYLVDMVDNGEINLAENLLFAKIEENHLYDMLELGLDFYVYLSSKSDDFLEEHNFSRQEISDGLEDLQKAFGLL